MEITRIACKDALPEHFAGYALTQKVIFFSTVQYQKKKSKVSSVTHTGSGQGSGQRLGL